MADQRQASEASSSGRSQSAQGEATIRQHHAELAGRDRFAGLQFPRGRSFQVLQRGSDATSYRTERKERNQDQASDPNSDDINFMHVDYAYLHS